MRVSQQWLSKFMSMETGGVKAYRSSALENESWSETRIWLYIVAVQVTLPIRLSGEEFIRI